MASEQHAKTPAPASEGLLALTPPTEPEDRLMLAVLLDAVAVLREHATGACFHDRALVAATVNWFLIQDMDWPLSFHKVCQGLGLEASQLLASLRIELAELGATTLLNPQRPRVVPLFLVHSVPGESPARSTRRR
jgi:hypothetical protein